MKAMVKFVKLIPYIIVVLGVLGAVFGTADTPAAVCCGIIAILGLFYAVTKDIK